MLADSDRLVNTIDQVLRAARNSSSRHLARSRIDLRTLVRECVSLALTRHHLPPDAVTYAESFNGLPPAVLGDVEELKAAVSNLLDNAVKYSGQQVRVMVEVANSEKDRFAVRVKDAGIGIPDSELKRIFKRFYRIQSTVAMRVKGTGLGLFIVRSVVERHGGRAFAESEGAGRGSTFTIELPSAPPMA
jgi:signal transduction histidine kinase